MRVVDAEDRDALLDPETEDLGQRQPQSLPVVGLEVDGIDVLVLLGWVLGVLDGSVGPGHEPLGVLRDPPVIGGALEGDVERQLETTRVTGVDDRVHVVEGPEVGMDGEVVGDPPWAADVTGCRLDAVVATLAMDDADRVDRREVDDIETHRGDVVEAIDHIAQGGGSSARMHGRPREQLVPGTETPTLGIDVDGERS